MPNLDRNPDLLSAASSRLLIIDMQEKLLPVISGFDEIEANCLKLIRGAAFFEVPVVATEQYPRGLGPTVPALAELISDRPEKLRFSGLEALPWALVDSLERERQQVVIAGIESHVCVLQTAFDLLTAGFDVFVVANATGSRRPEDAGCALQRMADSGIRIVTTEMVLFEWCEVAGTERFKALSRLVK